MKTRLLASCAAVAVLALSYTAAPAQQSAPEQRPAAGAAGDATTTTDKARRGGDAAAPRSAPSKTTDQPTSGRGVTRDQGRDQPAQAQSPAQDTKSGRQ